MKKSSTRKNTVNGIIAITILLVLSLIFMVIGSLMYYAQYTESYNEVGESVSELSYGNPLYSEQVSMFFDFTPIILFLAFVLILHRITPMRFTMSLVFGMMVIEQIYSFATTGSGGIKFFCIVKLVVIALAFLGMLIGYSKRGLIVPPMVFSFIIAFIDIFVKGVTSGVEEPTFVLFLIADFFGALFFHIALMVFGTRYKIPTNIPEVVITEIDNIKKLERQGKLSNEQALNLLNDKLAVGLITEKEYWAQREGIISKL